MTRSHAEVLFGLLCRSAGFPPPVEQHQFHGSRRWRFDFAWPDHRIAVEIEGITPGGGRHQRFMGFMADATKYEAAMLEGWTVYRVPAPWLDKRPKQVMDTLRTLFRYNTAHAEEDHVGHDRPRVPRPA